MAGKINYKNLSLFWSTKSDGNMSYKFENEEKVLNNRNAFFDRISIPQNNYYLNILNRDTIVELSEFSNFEIYADCVIIDKYDKYIYLAFGDCIPMVIYDTNNDIMSFSHLGWKSICLKLHNKVVSYMVNKLKCKIDDLKFFFGPSISSKSYIFPNPSQLMMPDWKQYVSKTQNGYSVDLLGYILNDLSGLGIDNDLIEKPMCYTATNPDFFSHYRSMHTGEKEGRFIFGAGLEKSE